MSRLIKHPTVEAVIAIHAEVIAAHGGIPGFRSRELLESAIAAPQATMMIGPLLTDPIEVAAAYMFYICGNHAFLDGNKRTALATALVFLSENGLLANEQLDTVAWESFSLDLAAGKLSRDQATKRFRKLLK